MHFKKRHPVGFAVQNGQRASREAALEQYGCSCCLYKKALNDMSGGYNRFLRDKHSLRKPHAVGSEYVKKSETEKACWK